MNGESICFRLVDLVQMQTFHIAKVIFLLLSTKGALCHAFFWTNPISRLVIRKLTRCDSARPQASC